jgi:outer membrane protein assembly complex protein YaeT
VLAAILCFAVFWCAEISAEAAKIEELSHGQTYNVEKIIFVGNHHFSDRDLRQQLSTKVRPVYLVWKERPAFDPDVLRADLERLRRFYQANGYYSATVDYDLAVSGDLVVVKLIIHEGTPVKVQKIVLQVDEFQVPPGEPPWNLISVKIGDIFTQDGYQNGAAALSRFFLDAGYARAQVKRWAEVNPEAHAAQLWYFAHPGDSAVFGNTDVIGLKTVDKKIVLRELTYQSGERYSQEKIDQSRSKIVALGLFGVVNFKPQLEPASSRTVPIKIVLKEKHKHEIRIGGGYNTESQFIANLEWKDMNWLGDGRQFSILARYSNIDSTVVATIKQPYLFDSPKFKGVLNFREDVQQVPPYTLFGTRLVPRIEYHVMPELMLYAGYQLEYDSLIAIDKSVIKALGGIKKNGILSGPNAGISVRTTDDLYNPTRGYIFTLDAIEGGGGFGGAYNFYRVATELKRYQLLGWGVVLANRLKLGIADAFGSNKNYPLFYRFYEGGEGSVRGYGYWRLGPKSSTNVPLGGLSMIEGSIELRRKIWGDLGGAMFLDFGQLSTRAYDIPVTDLQFGAGPALSYNTPLGPIRIDLGFPFRKPRGDQLWQIYFSIGQYF